MTAGNHRIALLWCTVLAIAATLVLIPIPAQALEPGDYEGPDCWRGPDAKATFYVPRDRQGHAFNYYCVNGERGIVKNPGDKVNGGGVRIERLKDWAESHGGLDGSVDFDQLNDEPCQSFGLNSSRDNVREGTNVNWWRQCAKITRHHLPGYDDVRLDPRPAAEQDADDDSASYGDVPLNFGRHHNYGSLFEATKQMKPCEQWRVTYELLGMKQDNNLTRNISVCSAANPIFDKMFRVVTRADPNQNYDRHDYTAPNSIRQHLDPLLGIAVWVGLFACVLGVIICGGIMVVARNKGEQATIGVFWVLGGCAIILSASGIVTVVLL